MKAIYKPFGLIMGILSGQVARKISDFIWTKFDDEEPPKATTKYAPLAKILAAAAMQGVVAKLTRVVVDRAGARGFEHLTGTWPGEQVQEPD